ncbi:hypothetical protein BZA70DRAFT_53424 [Myxozyma melibiosi]|uniref:Uncharacterized protein n=1 Tax=Myxozyma melibiosi TaxID=54550 RepID=A0ABR1FF88_9ASCO
MVSSPQPSSSLASGSATDVYIAGVSAPIRVEREKYNSTVKNTGAPLYYIDEDGDQITVGSFSELDDRIRELKLKNKLAVFSLTPKAGPDWRNLVDSSSSVASSRHSNTSAAESLATPQLSSLSALAETDIPTPDEQMSTATTVTGTGLATPESGLASAASDEFSDQLVAAFESMLNDVETLSRQSSPAPLFTTEDDQLYSETTSAFGDSTIRTTAQVPNPGFTSALQSSVSGAASSSTASSASWVDNVADSVRRAIQQLQDAANGIDSVASSKVFEMDPDLPDHVAALVRKIVRQVSENVKQADRVFPIPADFTRETVDRTISSFQDFAVQIGQVARLSGYQAAAASRDAAGAGLQVTRDAIRSARENTQIATTQLRSCLHDLSVQFNDFQNERLRSSVGQSRDLSSDELASQISAMWESSQLAQSDSVQTPLDTNTETEFGRSPSQWSGPSVATQPFLDSESEFDFIGRSASQVGESVQGESVITPMYTNTETEFGSDLLYGPDSDNETIRGAPLSSSAPAPDLPKKIPIQAGAVHTPRFGSSDGLSRPELGRTASLPSQPMQIGSAPSVLKHTASDSFPSAPSLEEFYKAGGNDGLAAAPPALPPLPTSLRMQPSAPRFLTGQTVPLAVGTFHAGGMRVPYPVAYRVPRMSVYNDLGGSFGSDGPLSPEATGVSAPQAVEVQTSEAEAVSAQTTLVPSAPSADDYLGDDAAVWEDVATKIHGSPVAEIEGAIRELKMEEEVIESEKTQMEDEIRIARATSPRRVPVAGDDIPTASSAANPWNNLKSDERRMRTASQERAGRYTAHHTRGLIEIQDVAPAQDPLAPTLVRGPSYSDAPGMPPSPQVILRESAAAIAAEAQRAGRSAASVVSGYSSAPTYQSAPPSQVGDRRGASRHPQFLGQDTQTLTGRIRAARTAHGVSADGSRRPRMPSRTYNYIEMRQLSPEAQDRADINRLGLENQANEAERECARALVELELISSDNMALAIYYAQQAKGDVVDAIDLLEEDLKQSETYERQNAPPANPDDPLESEPPE